jgi:hypothetical protein
MSQQELKPTQKPATDAAAPRLVSAFFVASIPMCSEATSVSIISVGYAAGRVDGIELKSLEGCPGVMLTKGKQRVFVPSSNVRGLVYE